MKFNKVEIGAEIPKVIHQTYPTTSLPAKIRKNIRKLKTINPNWEYQFYTDDDIVNYISQHYPSILEIYLSINPNYGAVRADLFRYLLMYKEGGVYLDIKSSFSKPLDKVLLPDDIFILSHWDKSGLYAGWGTHDEIADPKGEFLQCFIISTQGHPFIKSVIERIVKNIESYDFLKNGAGSDAVLRLTGPIAYTLAITPLLSSYKYRHVNSEKDLTFIYSIYSNGGHLDHFKKHYSKLTEAIILE